MPGKSLAAGANCSISATFMPQNAGAKSGAVSIADSASSKPQVIELLGTGTVVQLAPMSLNFGTQSVRTK